MSNFPRRTTTVIVRTLWLTAYGLPAIVKVAGALDATLIAT